jgi:hypothetical protein
MAPKPDTLLSVIARKAERKNAVSAGLEVGAEWETCEEPMAELSQIITTSEMKRTVTFEKSREKRETLIGRSGSLLNDNTKNVSIPT